MSPTKNTNTEVDTLSKVVQKQKETIGALQDRISSMSDELVMVSADLRKLREDVSEDLKVLHDKAGS